MLIVSQRVELIIFAFYDFKITQRSDNGAPEETREVDRLRCAKYEERTYVRFVAIMFCGAINNT